MPAELEFSRNDTLALMYKSEAASFRAIADYIEKWKEEFTIEEVVSYLRELADQQEAQEIVVKLRDELNP